jgi:hypothetical protein
MNSPTILQLANLILANTLKASVTRVAAVLVQGVCLAIAGLFLLMAIYNLLALVLPAWGALLVLAGLFLSAAGGARLYVGRLNRIAQQRRTSYLHTLAARASALLHIFDAARRIGLSNRHRP